MKKESEEKNVEVLMRLKRVLTGEAELSESVMAVMRGDLERVLLCYFDFEKNTLNVETTLDKDGKVAVVIKLTASKIKPIKIMF